MNDLFDTVKLSHTVDPPTSNEAAMRHVRTGKRELNSAIALTLVKANPGKTASELFELATPCQRDKLKELQEVRRRLTDLLGEGKVKQGMTKICTVRNTRMVTWEPI